MLPYQDAKVASKLCMCTVFVLAGGCLASLKRYVAANARDHLVNRNKVTWSYKTVVRAPVAPLWGCFE